MRKFILASAVLASTGLANSLYSRQSAPYPAPLEVGPQPKQEWIDTYNRVKAEGKIPGFAPSVLGTDGNPSYPSGTDTGENGVCSWTTAHCFGDNDISDAPDGMYAIAFDDGPLPVSRKLYQFLKDNNQTSTHFLIGSYIVDNPDVFAEVLAMGGHCGVHTWSHKYMTTLTDMQLLGEFGWTAQAIYDHSGGIVPRYWRPPYGDADNRVRAIAEEVFGLILVGWNRDSNDWCLNSGPGACPSYGPQSLSDLENELKKWQTGAKSPGCSGLEHESGEDTVAGFINTYAGIKENGWDARCIPDLFDMPWYQNAARNGTPVTTTLGIGVGNVSIPLTSSAAASSSVASVNSSTTAMSSTSVASQSTSASQSSSASETAAAKPVHAAQDTSGAASSRFGPTATTVACIGLGLATFALA
ncbi:hypothetical protein JCM8202_002770 [Rhodotorula sphaerocarpa]